MSLEKKSVPGVLLQTIKNYIDKHISILSTSLNNKNKTKRYKVKKGETSLSTGIAFITNESLITFDRIVGNPATSVNNIGVDGDYFVEDGGLIKFNPFNKDIIISVGVNYGTHDISQADILGQNTTENDISVMKHELDMLSGSGIGFEGIYYIQDVGNKIAGKVYLDKNQEGIWKCLNTTTSINNTSDFERIDTTTLDDKLRNLNTSIVESRASDMLAVTVYREGNVCFVIGFLSIASVYEPPYSSSVKIENELLFPWTYIDAPSGNTDDIIIGFDTTGNMTFTVGKKIGTAIESQYRFAFSYRPKIRL